MSKVRIELNRAGVGQLLKSDEVKNFISAEAERRAQGLGDGYGTDTYKAGTRVIASIFTESPEAAKENMENNTLLKAVSTSS